MQASNTSVDFGSLANKLYVYNIDPLYSARIYIDFSNIPDGFIYNTHYVIELTDQDKNTMTLPYYFSSDINNITDKN